MADYITSYMVFYNLAVTIHCDKGTLREENVGWECDIFSKHPNNHIRAQINGKPTGSQNWHLVSYINDAQWIK